MCCGVRSVNLVCVGLGRAPRASSVPSHQNATPCRVVTFCQAETIRRSPLMQVYGVSKCHISARNSSASIFEIAVSLSTVITKLISPRADPAGLVSGLAIVRKTEGPGPGFLHYRKLCRFHCHNCRHKAQVEARPQGLSSSPLLDVTFSTPPRSSGITGPCWIYPCTLPFSLAHPLPGSAAQPSGSS